MIRDSRTTTKTWCAYVRNGRRHASGQGYLDVARSNAAGLSESDAECSLHSSLKFVSLGCFRKKREAYAEWILSSYSWRMVDDGRPGHIRGHHRPSTRTLASQSQAQAERKRSRDRVWPRAAIVWNRVASALVTSMLVGQKENGTRVDGITSVPLFRTRWPQPSICPERPKENEPPRSKWIYPSIR